MPGGNPAGSNNRFGNAASQGTGMASTSNSFIDRAKSLFAEGKEQEATTMLYGEMLLNESAFDKYPLRWYGSLSQPRVFLRWGIGVSYRPDKDFSGIPPLIGDELDDSVTASGSGDPTFGAGGGSTGASSTGSSSIYSKVDTSVPAGMLLYYTGDYIERLYKRMNDRRTGGEGYFGAILKEMPERAGLGGPAAQRPVSAVDRARSRRNLPSAATGGGGGGGGNQGGPPQIDSEGGSGSDSSSNLLDKFNSTSDASEPAPNVLGTLMPGVMCVGEGKEEDLLERAKKMNLDAVLIFQVKVIESRKKFFSQTALKVYDPNKPDEELAKTKSLRNSLVMEERENSRSDDPVEESLDKLFQEYIDTNLRGADLPVLTPEVVESRVDSILQDPQDKLRAAVEVMGYFRKDLLSMDKAQAALDELLNGGGSLLLTGNSSDKQQFVEKVVAEFAGQGRAAGIR
ncbi:MAG: hypothetical protein R3C03_12850 [Pirellulaceae bacterium]